jgi:hypothetical protein
MTRPECRFAAALLLLALTGACAVAPPPGPMVLATPPVGKDLNRFRQEDAFCRDQALAAAGGGANRAPAAAVAAQQAYDAAFAACMTDQGNAVQAGVLPPTATVESGPVPYVTPYTTPLPPVGPGAWDSPWSPGWGGFGAPRVTLGFGYGYGFGSPGFYGRPYYGRPWSGPGGSHYGRW